MTSSSKFPTQQSQIIKSLESELRKFGGEVTEKNYKLSNQYTFYENNQSEKRVEIFVTKSALFDVILAVLILIYLFIIYVSIVGLEKAKSEINSIFNKN